MKDENKKIDAFFSTRLQNETVGEDEWNIPSDDIWYAAKSKFIDRKKPRRRFVFWFMIPLLALALSIPIKLLEGEEMSTHTNLEKQLSKDSNDEKAIVNVEQGSLGINEKESSSNQTNTNKLGSSVSASIINSEQKIPREKPLVEKRNIQIENSDLKLRSNQIQNDRSRIVETLIGKKYRSSDVNKSADAIRSKLEKESTKNIDLTRQELDIPFLNTINAVSKIDKRQIAISENRLLEYQSKINLIDPKFIIPIANPVYRNEIGISHSQLLLNLFLAFDIDTDNDVDEYSHDSKYFNANVTGRKWLNNRWSLMTGLQYSNLNFDLQFSVIDTLDKDIMEFINEEINDIQSQSSIRNQEADIDIELKDGIDIQLGDLLNLKGDVQLKVSAFQVPVFLDYHIYRKKVEYIFGLGVTLEHLSVSQTTRKFEVYKSSQLVGKLSNVPEYKERYFNASIYLKSGIRYKISNQFNLGLDAKVNLLGLPFSGLDLGLYYRWN